MGAIQRRFCDVFIGEIEINRGLFLCISLLPSCLRFWRTLKSRGGSCFSGGPLWFWGVPLAEDRRPLLLSPSGWLLPGTCGPLEISSPLRASIA